MTSITRPKNIEEAKECIMSEEVDLNSDFSNTTEWRNDRDNREIAIDILIADRYDQKAMKRIVKIASKLGEHDQEKGYEKAYETAYNKAKNVLSSEQLSIELKIKALENKAKELRSFDYEVRHGDFSCLKIGLEIEIVDDIKKGKY